MGLCVSHHILTEGLLLFPWIPAVCGARLCEMKKENENAQNPCENIKFEKMYGYGIAAEFSATNCCAVSMGYRIISTPALAFPTKRIEKPEKKNTSPCVDSSSIDGGHQELI